MSLIERLFRWFYFLIDLPVRRWRNDRFIMSVIKRNAKVRWP